ncbi:hypothetical protein ELH97_13120 [Rhizobium leguminosarum]|nr:hypothetical protein KS05_09495 [Rhizobium brockwellii]TAX39941.1 hypothetical protein ELI05_13650 [Rhizobium leguminosarum]TAX92821.1 hypothetical protein ELH97_13120 [Rhizobium leguminosarum]TAX97356.1 hypothetical protein ELH94_12980 [Rhizobium leguminosarum]TAY88649.1 hypothetical protein ELH83_13070 [Rhizobium leguminosarum]
MVAADLGFEGEGVGFHLGVRLSLMLKAFVAGAPHPLSASGRQESHGAQTEGDVRLAQTRRDLFTSKSPIPRPKLYLS